jgi:hypothetical protein
LFHTSPSFMISYNPLRSSLHMIQDHPAIFHS